jgi:hypothetical protein
MMSHDEEDQNRREREAQAVIRIPYALSGVLALMMLQFGAGLWWASTFAAESRAAQLQTQVDVRELKSEVKDLNVRLYLQTTGLQELAEVKRMSIDQENRIRELERMIRR